MTSTIEAIFEAAQFTFVGRAVKQPEAKYFDTGKTVCKVRMAVNNGKDAEPHWFTVEAWDQQAQKLADDCEKGTMLKVTGRVVTNRWQTKAGEDRTDLIIKAQQISILEASRSAPQKEALPF